MIITFSNKVPEEYDWGIHNISFTDSKEIKDTEHLNGRTSISPNQQPLYRISPESGWNAAKNVCFKDFFGGAKTGLLVINTNKITSN